MSGIYFQVIEEEYSGGSVYEQDRLCVDNAEAGEGHRGLLYYSIFVNALFFFIKKKFKKLESEGSRPNWLGSYPGSATPVTWPWTRSITFLNLSFHTYNNGSVHFTVLLVKIKLVNIYKACEYVRNVSGIIVIIAFILLLPLW